MAEWYRYSGKSVCLWSCRLWFDSELGQTKDFNTGTVGTCSVVLGIHTSLLHCLELCLTLSIKLSKGQCEDQSGKFTHCDLSILWLIAQ